MSEQNPVHSYGRHLIDEDDVNAVIRTLKSDFLTQGPAVFEFENALCARFGSKFAFALNNGTSALHLAGLTLDWGSSDLVLTTPITFMATANAALYCGTKVGFVDIDPVHYTIDCDSLEQKLRELNRKNQRVSAVVAVDFAGQSCDWERLRTLAGEYGFVLIDDASHALGTRFKGVELCSAQYADIVTTSFHPVKHLTTAEGGAFFTNDSRIAKKAASLKTHGVVRDETVFEEASPGPWYHEMQILGHNFRLPDVLCALGTSQLAKLDRFLERRSDIARKYDELLKDAGVTLPRIRPDSRHTFHLYPVLFDFKTAGLSKRAFFDAMKKDGVILQVHYIPVHLQPYYRRRFGFKTGDFPVAESFYEKEFSIPMHPGLQDGDLVRIAEMLKEHLGSKK